MDSIMFELQIVFYVQLFLSSNVRHKNRGGENESRKDYRTISKSNENR